MMKKRHVIHLSLATMSCRVSGKSSIKIVHVIDSGGLYGAEIMLLALAVEQVKFGVSVEIVSIGGRGEPEKPFEKEAKRRGIDVYPFRMFNGPNYLGAIQIIRRMHGRHVDILHSHGYKGNILFGLMPRFLRDLPMVSTVHGWTNTEPLSKLRIYEEMDALSLRLVDAVVVVNRAMLENPRLRKIPCDRVHIIENGIPRLNLAEAAAPDQQIVEFCLKKWTVVSIGRLTKEKGHAYLIKAFAQLIDRGVDAQLLIIGEGPERVSLEMMIHDRGLGAVVYLPGYRDDAWKYLPLCKVFVIASLTEGLPITLLEAMQMGIPVVATAVGGIPHILSHGETGLIVSPCDPESLHCAIREIVHHIDKASAMVGKARDAVTSHFLANKMAQSYLSIYQKLL